MDTNVVYHIQPGPLWDWRVAMDLFLGGAGVGAFVFAVAIDSLYRQRYERITRTAAWLAPILVIAGIAFLMAKLGRPWNSYQIYLHFAPTSPLWWGGIFQAIFIAGALAYAWMWRDRETEGGRRRLLAWVLTPIALIVGAYHGLLLAVVVARPLWNTGPTVVAALLAFLATGIAAVMLVHLVRMWRGGRLAPDHLEAFITDMRPVRNVLVAALVLQIGTCFLWWLSLRFGDLDQRAALAAAEAEYGVLFWVFGIGVGLVLPLILGAWVTFRGPHSPMLEIRTIALTSALILIGGYCFRLAVVLGGQAVPIVPRFS